ncbi:MAG: hypothetical protein J6C44_08690 [Muribaculaceae bacterium]|jgi:hypothetical protein|nr:hypothetical protein [Muribaculaceae bacterium]
MNDTTQKIRPTLYEMAVGDSIKFPISRLKSVRTQASELGMMYERQYTTKTDRADKTIEVTRIA